MTAGKKYRAEVVEAMDILARSINDENIIDSWLYCGVADCDIDYTAPQEERLETVVSQGYTDDQTFSELMGLFLRIMSRAQEDGLYVDGVLSEKGESR